MILIEPPRMRPLTNSTGLAQMIQDVLHNIRMFDHVRFQAWLQTQPGSIAKAAQCAPPDRLYRLHVATDAQTYGVVVGYRPCANGLSGQCALQILGATLEPIFVPPDALEDVTDTMTARARARATKT